MTPSFPAEVSRGDLAVPATLELASSSLFPLFVTSLTLNAGGLTLAPAALGTGTGCPIVPFVVSGPDSTGQYTFIPATPLVLPPFGNVARPSCTIPMVFGVPQDQPSGEIRQVAALTGFTVPGFFHSFTGSSTSTLRRVPVSLSVTAPGTSPQGRSVAARATLTRPPAVLGPAPPAPGGTVTFAVFGPADLACRGQALRTTPPQPVEGSSAASPALQLGAAGTYHLVARYSGDAVHAPADSDCAGAAVTVAPIARRTTTSTTIVSTTTAPPTTSVTAAAPPPSTPIPPGTGQGPAGRRKTVVRLPVYEPAAHAEDIVGVQVSAFALLALLGAAGARSAGGSAQKEREEGALVTTEIEEADEGLAGEGLAATVLQGRAVERGDRSWSWRWPATARVDRLSCDLPPRIAPRSPLLARIINDAGYLRAVLGSGALLLPMLGGVLGGLAVVDVDGQALPPSFALAIALAVLGVFDAVAGLVGVVVFVGGVVLLGGLASADAARTLLGLATLWFAAPLIAGTARPLRRPPTSTFEEHFDRTADVVIASLVGAWAVQTILQGLPGLAGLDLPIAKQADTAALVVLAALAVRMAIETVAAHWYPQRLARVQPAELPGPAAGQRLAAHFLILAVFLFVAVSYLGSCWQLYVGGALFVLPKLLQLGGDRLPNSPRLHRLMPQGIAQTVLLLAVGVVLGTVVLGRIHDGQELLRNSFVILAIPGFVLSVLGLLGREGPDREFRWQQQLLGGVPLLVLGGLLALGILG